MNAKVTIICTTYNQKEYICDALDGFLNQETDFKYKVIVHDDASTDGTSDIIREYAKKYPDIIYPIIQEHNLYSRGIDRKPYLMDLIEGDYIAVCEGDDYWTDANKLQMQYDFLENHKDYSLCATATTCLDVTNNQILDMFKCDNDRDVLLDEIIEERNGRIFHFASLLMKKEVYLDSPHWKITLGLGTLGNAMSAVKYGKIRMLSKNTNVYRFKANGSWTNRVSRSNDSSKKISFKQNRIDAFLEYDEETKQRYHGAIQYAVNKDNMYICMFEKNLNGLLFGKGKKGFHELTMKQKIVTLICTLKK